MNTRDYRNAMDQLNPAPDLEGRIKEQLNLPPKRQAHPRRLAGKVLAAAAAIACTFMVAMAVSPQLRAAVLTFFHLEETEQVPGPVGEAPEEPEMTQTTIDDLVEAQYIRLPGLGCSYGGGVIYQAERADDGSLLDIRYWAAEGDELVPLETHATGFSAVWDGLTYEDTVYWCEYGCSVSCHCDGTAGMAADYDCYVRAIPGRTDVVLLVLSQGSQVDYRQYTVLLDLTTGAITDLLDGTGWEAAAPVREAQWTDDLSAAILSSDRMGWFYCDREAKTTVRLDELTGLEVFSTWFTSGGDALILLTRSGPEGDCYDTWTYQPDSGVLIQTFSQLPVYRSREGEPYGFWFSFGSRWGIYTQEDGAVSVLDLTTGGTTGVENFSLPRMEGSLMANFSGSKILFATHDEDTDGLGISSLGVMDLEKGVFTLLDRDSGAGLHEASLGWFDENRVAIWGYAAEDFTQACLYLYRF